MLSQGDILSPTTPTSPHSERKRSRRACEPCRRRKKKCDGQQPCKLCVSFEYDCYYVDLQRRHRAGKQRSAAASSPSFSPLVTGSSTQQPISVAEPTRASQIADSVFASSVFTFPSLLAKSLSSSGGGEQRPQGSIHTLGLRERPRASEDSLRQLITLADVLRFSRRHFAIVHIWHDYLVQSDFEAQVMAHWQDESIFDPAFEILTGFIVALGSFFSWPSQFDPEERIVNCAESWINAATVLDGSSRVDMFMAAAHIERTLYYRATASLRMAWMASCSAVHVAESMCLHKEWDNLFLVAPKEKPSLAVLDRRRRLFWVAKNINAMISAEYGRSKVQIAGMTCLPPERRVDEPASILSDLTSMLPEDSYSTTDLLVQGCVTSIEKLSQTSCSHNYAQLVVGEMACLAYRRLASAGYKFTESTKRQILTLVQKALQATIEISDEHLPWWKLTQTPFQVLCTLLSINEPDSLAIVSDALRAITHVHSIFNTRRTKDADEAAQFMVKIALQRKEKEVLSLRQGLSEVSQTMEPMADDIFDNIDIDWAELMSGEFWNADVGV